MTTVMGDYDDKKQVDTHMTRQSAAADLALVGRTQVFVLVLGVKLRFAAIGGSMIEISGAAENGTEPLPPEQSAPHSSRVRDRKRCASSSLAPPSAAGRADIGLLRSPRSPASWQRSRLIADTGGCQDPHLFRLPALSCWASSKGAGAAAIKLRIVGGGIKSGLLLVRPRLAGRALGDARCPLGDDGGITRGDAGGIGQPSTLRKLGEGFWRKASSALQRGA